MIEAPKNNDLFYLVLGGLAGFVLALGVTGHHSNHDAHGQDNQQQCGEMMSKSQAATQDSLGQKLMIETEH
jgi:hypothetical protein